MKAAFILILSAVFATAQGVAGDVSGYPLGYCNGEVTTNAIVKYAVRDVAVSGAIYIPGSYASTVAGNEIRSVRFGLGSTRNISEVRVWVRSSLEGEDLGGSPSVTSFRQGWNEAELEKPVAIDESMATGGFYIGYTFTQSYTSAGLAALSTPSDGGMWVKCGDGDWENRSAEGTLCIEGMVYGSVLPRLNVHVEGVATDKWYIVSRGVLGGVITVRNIATEKVTSLEIEGRIDGIAQSCKTNVECNLAYNEVARIPFTLTPGFVADDPRRIEGVFTVTAVNGAGDEDMGDNSATASFFVINEAYPRKVLLEEFTTLSCSNCPRVAGYIHEMLEDPQYANSVEAVCHHSGFGTDIYTIEADNQYTWFYNSTTTYAPAIMLDRAFAEYDHTPVFLPSDVEELKEAVERRLEEPAVVSLEVAAEKSESVPGTVSVIVAGNVVDRDAFCENPRITVYLVEDNIATDNQAGAGSGYVLQHTTHAVNATWGETLNFNEDNSYSYSCTLAVPYDEKYYKWEDMKVVAVIGNMNAEDVMDCVVENCGSAPVKIAPKPGTPQPLGSYTMTQEIGAYKQIEDGTVVLDRSVFEALVDDGMADESMEIKSMVFGAGGSICMGTLPQQPSSLPGIPLGFEFPYAGESFTHFLFTAGGAVILGGETIGGLVLGGTMDGSMGKFIFNSMSNVLGCVTFWAPYCLENTEISYLTEDNALTIQYRNLGFARTMSSSTVTPVDMQLRLTSDGDVKISFAGWSSMGEDMTGQVRVALKGSGDSLLTLLGAADGNNIVGSTLDYYSESARDVNVYSTLPDGFTMTIGPSNEECVAPETDGVLNVSTTSGTLDASFETVSGESDCLLFVLSEAPITWTPRDGTEYEVGEKTGGITVISAGRTTNVFVEELKPDTRYYVGVWPYNNIGLNAPKYQKNGQTPPFAISARTMVGAPQGVTVAASTVNTLTLDIEGNDRNQRVIVLMTEEVERNDNVSDDPLVGGIDPYKEYKVGDEIEGGGEVVYIGAPGEGIVIDGLSASTPYYFAAYTLVDDETGYTSGSSEGVFAAGTTVVVPPYEMDFSRERRFVPPAGWEAYWDTPTLDGIAVWRQSTGGIRDESPSTTTYFLRFALGGISPETGADAWVVTSPILVDMTGYTAEMVFNGLIYPTNPRDPAMPLSLAEGDFISLGVSADGGLTFTDAMVYTKENFVATKDSVAIRADLSEYEGREVRLKFEWKTSVESGPSSGGSQLYITSYTIKREEDSGVADGIENDTEGRYVVYTATGIRVLDTKDPADLQTLTPGLYIVNGRKILVTK